MSSQGNYARDFDRSSHSTSLTDAATLFSVPAFNPGKKSPTKTKTRNAKHSVENRKNNFKKGIDPDANRQLRTNIGRNVTTLNKKKTIAHLRSELRTSLEHQNRTKLNGVDSENPNPNRLGSEREIYTGTVREKVYNFYTIHNPMKLDEVDKLLAKYSRNEEELLKKLAKKYEVDPSVFGIVQSSPTLEGNVVATGPFLTYVGRSTSTTFGSLASPAKWKSKSNGFGPINQIPGGGSKGRTTLTSLKTHVGDVRTSSDNHSDDDMDCD